MASWSITAADRDQDGKIKTQFAAILDESLQATGATPDADEPPAQPPLSRRQVALLVGAALILVAALAALLAQPETPPAVPPTAAPTIVPSPLLTPPPEVRHVTAYAAPGGTVLGPIPVGASPIARYGDGWVQVAWDGGAVWVEAAADSTLPDLAPPTAATAAPAPIAAPPPPTAEPLVCVGSIYGQRCGPASAMADRDQIMTEIATESKRHSEAWPATATTEAAAREASHDRALRDLDATREAQP